MTNDNITLKMLSNHRMSVVSVANIYIYPVFSMLQNKIIEFATLFETGHTRCTAGAMCYLASCKSVDNVLPVSSLETCVLL